MLPVKDAIRALQKELEESLSAGTPPPAGAVQVSLDRVMVSLPLRFTPSSGNSPLPATVEVAVPEGVPPGSTPVSPEAVAGSMTLEFRLLRPGSPLELCLGAALDPGRPTPLGGADAERLTKLLASALGVPGFDSSARATVLCDALEPLSESQRAALLGSLDGAPRSDSDPVIRRARHRLASVLRSGPLHSVPKGGHLLREVLSGHPPEQVLDLIRRTWKTQEEWMEEAP